MQKFLDAVTSFIFVQDQPQRSDIIFIPGSREPEHIHLAASLYQQGYAPLVLPSGRWAKGRTGFADPVFDTEWAYMRNILLSDGVPDQAILREDCATYTWENAQFSRRVLDAAGITPVRALICCKPHHARRALFYYQAAFPDTELLVIPAVKAEFRREDWYSTPAGRAAVLGEVQRLGGQIQEVLAQTLEKENHHA